MDGPNTHQPHAPPRAIAQALDRKIGKSCQLPGQSILETISAFAKHGIKSHDEKAIFNFVSRFGSQGRRRETLEGFGNLFRRF